MNINNLSKNEKFIHQFTNQLLHELHRKGLRSGTGKPSDAYHPCFAELEPLIRKSLADMTDNPCLPPEFTTVEDKPATTPSSTHERDRLVEEMHQLLGEMVVGTQVFGGYPVVINNDGTFTINDLYVEKLVSRAYYKASMVVCADFVAYCNRFFEYFKHPANPVDRLFYMVEAWKRDKAASAASGNSKISSNAHQPPTTLRYLVIAVPCGQTGVNLVLQQLTNQGWMNVPTVINNPGHPE